MLFNFAVDALAMIISGAYLAGHVHGVASHLGEGGLTHL
jgi:hypothetical protein